MRIHQLFRVLLCFLYLQSWDALAQEVSEYELKVAYIYNFALFTTWPSESNTAIVFCIFRQDPLSSAIEALQGRKIRNRPITIRKIILPEEVHTCDLIFLGATQSEAFPKVLELIKNSNILTITDSTDQLRKEMAINMAFEDKRLIFEVNLASARRANLQFSSKLLNLTKSQH
jgi:uncharacterized protein DUF4154